MAVRKAWFVILALTLVLYAVMPDKYPGPIDDAILIILGGFAEFLLLQKIKSLS